MTIEWREAERLDGDDIIIDANEVEWTVAHVDDPYGYLSPVGVTLARCVDGKVEIEWREIDPDEQVRVRVEEANA